MSFNYQLAKEIYGLTPWLVDEQSLPSLMGILASVRKGNALEVPEIKYNTPYIFDVKSATEVITAENFAYRDMPQGDFEGVGVINIDGPITKSGGMSSLGMMQLSRIMSRMALDERIKCFMIVGDSGGGSSAAVELMTDTISEVKKTKPVYGLVSKGGMSASAMYGIHSACNKIFAESEMSIVGSAGTMIQFEGKAANTTDKDGTKNIRLYATKSVNKNKGFEEALNKDNYTVLTDELLDPINENFLSMIVKNRPMLKGTTFDTGETVFAKAAVGTYIDGIASFEQTVKMVMTDYKSNYKSTVKNKNNSNLITNSMTPEELKQQHPATYNSIFEAGVSSERDRSGAFLAHIETDPQAVKKGILAGNPLTATEREELLVKASSQRNIATFEKESAPAIITAESTIVDKAQETEEKSFYAEVAKSL